MITNEELKSYVDLENGLISPHVFSSQEVYELELERVFGRTWLFLAHESQIPKAGDFFSTYMGADPVLAVRQKDGSVKAFLNFCRHRGMRVCRADRGNAKAFTCTYHGWAYDVAGNLVSVASADDAYHGKLELSKWGLKQVPRLEIYKGFVFGCFDESVPPLLEYLGEDMKYYFDYYFDRREGGVEIVGGVTKTKMPANWKMAAEQFAGDSYHAAFTHISNFSVVTAPHFKKMGEAAANAAAAAPGGAPGPGPGGPPGAGSAEGVTKNVIQGNVQAGRQFASTLGHGSGFRTVPGTGGFQMTGGDPIIDQYEASILPEVEARLGKDRVQMNNLHCNVFPNFSWLNPVRTLRVWHPKGPNSMECWSFVFVDKQAPEEVKQATRWVTQIQFGPAGLAEQDDGENWGLIAGNLAGHGPQIHKLKLNYTQGLGFEGEDPEYPGLVSQHLWGEMPQRMLYKRWAEFMTASENEWPMPAAFEPTHANGVG
jgi:3-phenylpropionate/trans-cinnamate dioxygenase alpha subunit